MPQFAIQFEDMGFMGKTDLHGASLTQDFLDGFNETMRVEGNFPAGVVAVREAYATPDDDQVGEEDIKFFLPITLIIEAPSEAAANNFESPKAFLATVADSISEISGSDLQGNWEVMDVELVEEVRPKAQGMKP